MRVGDIYITKYHPSVGAEMSKYRPSVLVGFGAKGWDKRLVCMVPLTSNVKHDSREIVMKVPKRPGLDKDSLALVWYVHTHEISRLQEKVSELSAKEIQVLKTKLRSLFR